jgi:hypothetical protein
MYKFLFIFLFLSITSIIGCSEKKRSEAYYESSRQFSALTEDLKKKFTTKAAYNSIMLSYDKLMGNTLLVKVSPDIDSSYMEEWLFMNGKWDKKSTIEIDKENQSSSEILFSINGDFELSKVVDMIEIAKEKVLSEKKVKNSGCKSVSILLKNIEGSTNKMDHLIIYISIEATETGALFDISFDSKGNFEGFLE